MAYGRISETFWHDDRIRSLTGRGRHFMLYLMSCPHGNRLGLFVLDPMYAAADVQWSPDEVKTALQELHDAERIAWDARNRVVFVRNYLKHNTLLNQSVVKGAKNDLRGVPDTPLLRDLLEAVKEAQVGPEGNAIMSHYRELERDVHVRAAKSPPPGGGNGARTPLSHNAEHDAGHNAAHQGSGGAPKALESGQAATVSTKKDEAPGTPAHSEESHNAEHNAGQAWEGTGSSKTTTGYSLPSLPLPSLTTGGPPADDTPADDDATPWDEMTGVDRLRHFLGKHSRCVDELPHYAASAIGGLYAPGGTDERVWGDAARDERPALLATAILRWSGEQHDLFQQHFFRAMLQDIAAGDQRRTRRGGQEDTYWGPSAAAEEESELQEKREAARARAHQAERKREEESANRFNKALAEARSWYEEQPGDVQASVDEDAANRVRILHADPRKAPTGYVTACFLEAVNTAKESQAA